MRLDKFVCQCSGLSRKEVKQALRQGLIMVEGHRARDAALKLKGHEIVSFKGQPLSLPKARYLMMYKPAGVVCARQDANQPCITDLLSPALLPGLQIVGRLDKDTTGLLLLTDDGGWNHRITAPRRQCPKVYRVTTAEPIPADAATIFRAGVTLKDNPTPTRPAALERISSHQARLTLHEGRYHQVKRMFAALGNRVTELHRESVAGLVLDPALKPGEFRALTDEEVDRV